MYYLIATLLIVSGLLLAILGRKKYNLSLALSFVILNSGIVFFLSDMVDSSYWRYAYYVIFTIGLLILFLAKIFTYIYFLTISWFMLAILWASFYASLNLEVKGFEGWVITGLSIVALILLRKRLKQIVIGSGSGYMIGLGVAAIGFRSILKMGWEYIVDSIYFPGLAIVLFVIAGVLYQYYSAQLGEDKQTLTKKQINMYFGGGSLGLLVLFILLPKLLIPSKSKFELATDELTREVNSSDYKESVEKLKSLSEGLSSDQEYQSALEKLEKARHEMSKLSSDSSVDALKKSLLELEELSDNMNEESLKELKNLKEKLDDYKTTHTEKSEIRRPSRVKYALVASNKAYFHDDDSNPRSAYLISGQAISYNKKKGNFIYASYTNQNGKTTNGWMNISDVELTDYDLISHPPISGNY